jgi:uncharacterized protein (TIGR02266 family)
MTTEKATPEGGTGERRDAPRFGVEFWVQEHAGGGVYFHRVTNLSISGFFIAKQLPFPEGQEVELRLELPGQPDKLAVRGVVVSNYQDHDARLLGAGVRFLDLNEAARKRIQSYLVSVAQTQVAAR